MTAKRFEVVMNEFDEVEYIMDKVMMEDRDFAEFIDFVEDVCKENEQLKEALKNEYWNEICENCKYGKYERNWYGEGEFECLKKHFGNDDWKCDGLKECDDFELDLKRFLK